uniref:Aspartic peptidase DDI1-type domain-containing protein n=1 Tax=Ditylum brightwellii TaxID=49249 RepID=A0A7S4R2L5_9STRA|mmetsp:Transcript_1440/g.2279  ORF Transcript_1440/g.2279 Transcript_1440/m.2279 type:complete len:504 (-) Transcript_1440:282-1793(-)
MSANQDEITVVLINQENDNTESICVSKSSTTLSELFDFASALFNLQEGSTANLISNGRVLYSSKHSASGSKTLMEVGLTNGDMVLVHRVVPAARTAGRGVGMSTGGITPAAGSAGGAGGGGGGGGGLDFSSLLASAGIAAPPSAPSTALTSSSTSSSSTTTAPSSRGLTFDLTRLANANTQQKVEWERMTLDDAMSRNPNPEHFIEILLDELKHPNLMKELNHHNPALAMKIKDAGIKDGARIWRENVMKGSIDRVFHSTMTKKKEQEMTERLRANPMDEEANKYFGEKIRKENVEAQYYEMMEQYPESMGRVLMLYIDAEVNGHPIQAFVDSGAQSTIMSYECADKCGLLHLLDTRFAGTMVGVGTGKILGRVHITPLKIKGHFFPCTITVTDKKEGLGDKNMDFLFGLDMLKRHRCKIDLETNSLIFTVGDGRYMEAPFLHEHDLTEAKGGTKGFDAEKSNAEVQRAIDKVEDGDAMEVDEDGGNGSNSKKVDNEKGNASS